jgi:hypothetical protein
MEGRIDQWQPRRRQQRKRRNTKSVSVKRNQGDAMSVPKVFCGALDSLPAGTHKSKTDSSLWSE